MTIPSIIKQQLLQINAAIILVMERIQMGCLMSQRVDAHHLDGIACIALD